MKTGISLYSLSRAINAKEMTVVQAIEWMAENGAEHVEIVPCGFSPRNEALRITETPSAPPMKAFRSIIVERAGGILRAPKLSTCFSPAA